MRAMGGEEVGATAGEARQAVLTKATETMFDKWGTYLKGEVQASVEDHLVLEKLHTATAAKFQELAATAGALNGQMAALQVQPRADNRPADGLAQREREPCR